jgi:5'-nucleotidase / UDP-sugar diphosphatase
MNPARRGTALFGLLLFAAAPPAAAQHELHATFLHTSDEHSALLPFPLVHHGVPGATARGGFSRLATAIETQRGIAGALREPVLVTSAGDHLSGSPFAWLALDGAGTELELLVELGYDVVTLGNHEFDYDSDHLARYIAAAGYPAAAERTVLLATNTHPPAGHPLGAIGLRRTHIRELPNGLRIGFIGLIGRGAARFATRAPPVTFGDPATDAAAAVAQLREAGAHVVVALTHAGVREDRELARRVPGIDIILGGHDHVLIEQPLVEGRTLIVHPGAYTQHLFALQIAYDTASRSVRVRNAQTGTPFVIELDEHVPEADWMVERVQAARARLETMIAERTQPPVTALDAAVARSGFTLRAGPPLEETPLGNFVTDAMRWAVERATGLPVDFAFQANGVIRSDLPAGTGARAGDIVLYDLASAVGMGSGPDGSAGYPIVSLWLTGEEVRRVLEISVLLSELLRNSYYLQASGVRMRYDPRRAILFRVPFRGTPVPTGRAVLHAERADGAHDLSRGDATLYHVVTDYYVASFLPMVGSMLPSLALRPRRRDGTDLAEIDDAIVSRHGTELKVWQAVLEYAASQPPDEQGVPAIPARYSEPEGRLVQTSAAPLWLSPLLALLLVVVAGIWLLRRRQLHSR